MNGDRGPQRREGGDETFRILYVCTGNICRSPTAEILTRHLLKGRLGGRDARRFDVSSVGVRAVAGSAMHPMARAQLAPWGLEGAHSAQFVARQLGRTDIENVDVVLGASSGHRSSVLENYPELLDRTFTLREFARLAAAVPTVTLPPDLVKRARTIVVEARQLRGQVDATDDDRIPDPMGGPPEAHQMSTALIFEALRALLDVLALRRPARAPLPRVPLSAVRSQSPAPRS